MHSWAESCLTHTLTHLLMLPCDAWMRISLVFMGTRVSVTCESPFFTFQSEGRSGICFTSDNDTWHIHEEQRHDGASQHTSTLVLSEIKEEQSLFVLTCPVNHLVKSFHGKCETNWIFFYDCFQIAGKNQIPSFHFSDPSDSTDSTAGCSHIDMRACVSTDVSNRHAVRLIASVLVWALICHSRGRSIRADW